jgi:hypothetical protein
VATKDFSPDMQITSIQYYVLVQQLRPGHTLLEMVMEILTLMGNLPRTGCVIVSKSWKKKFRKSKGIFIINATKILPQVKISHENNILLEKFLYK